MPTPRQRVDVYLDTVERLEPEIAMIDSGAAGASVAISLKRIADALEWQNARQHHKDELDLRIGGHSFEDLYDPPPGYRKVNDPAQR